MASVPALVLLAAAVSLASATYLPLLPDAKADKLHRKSSHVFHGKRAGPAFKDDWDVLRYLKLFGTDMMLWRCKNAIQPFWDWKPLPLVELYCEVLGTIKGLTWFRNGERIDLGDRFSQVATPHYAHDKYFSRWINFRLKIRNATMADSGIYTFQATSVGGAKEEQMIYLDISEKKPKKRAPKKKRKKRLKSRKIKLKKYLRKRRKWDYFSYRKHNNNHVYFEP